MSTSPARGRRILVVEDEFLVAAMLQQFLEDHGVTVIGPAYNIDDALALAKDATFDAAILDVNVRGIRIDPVAASLSERRISFALATGYGKEVVAAWADAPLLAKPYCQADVERVLAQLFPNE